MIKQEDGYSELEDEKISITLGNAPLHFLNTNNLPLLEDIFAHDTEIIVVD